MKHVEIVGHYREYMKQNKHRIKPILEGEPLAILFGSDQFKINHNKKQIKTAPFGNIYCSQLTVHFHPSWVAIIEENGEYDVLLGFDNPFDERNRQNFPQKNGLTMAMPFLDASLLA